MTIEIEFEISEEDVYYILDGKMSNPTWTRVQHLGPSALFTLQDIAQLLEVHAPAVDLGWERGKYADFVGLIIDNEMYGSYNIESPDVAEALYHYMEGYLFGKHGVKL